MEERNIKVTLDKAKEWYNSSNITLKELALQAFGEQELKYNFKEIKTFEHAVKALGYNKIAIDNILRDISYFSRASAAMFKLNIVRKALNLGQDLHLTKSPKDSYIYYPYNSFITRNSTYYDGNINSNNIEVIGKIKSNGEIYKVMGKSASSSSSEGIGFFNPNFGVGYANAAGFLCCASKEIASHFSQYFGMLITEAKYGDLPDFKIIESKYELL